ncbi:MAG TPA: polysaccharide biosynthesis/export family protein, partial [Chitinophagaceae bacterium]|nr:polysaccharide biosynthesis/export family protein [Chitinophagaceae bacterium]
MRTIKTVIYCLTLICLYSGLSSCANTQKATYFNNITNREIDLKVQNLEPVIQKGDLLSITISSLNPEATVIYNLPNTTTSAANSNNVQVAGYLVNQDGFIQFPVLGSIQAAGLSKKALKDAITKQLTDKKLLLDPLVSIRYLNFRVTVLGEVA